MTKTFSADGTQYVAIPQGGSFSVAPNGTFGSGTLNVKYWCNGSLVVYSGGDTGAFTAADERVFENVGDRDEIALVFAGSTAPALNVPVNPVK